MGDGLKKNIVFRADQKMRSEIKEAAEEMELKMADVIRLCIKGELPHLKAKYKELIGGHNSR